MFEYASMPVHGTLSRKLRKGVSVQINDGTTYDEAVLFLGEEFVRVTGTNEGRTENTYYDWARIASVRTYGPSE